MTPGPADVALLPLTIDQARAVADGQATDVGEGQSGRTTEMGEDVLPAFVAAEALQRHHDGESWFWCAARLIVKRGDPRPVGSCSFKTSPRDGVVEIGYGVGEAYRGRGFATQAVALLLAEAFSQRGVSRVLAETSAGNVASQRVVERNGFTRHAARVDDENGGLLVWVRDRPGRVGHRDRPGAQ
jgi:RimJ/RimL family protein N-acetyltransferase